MCSYAHYGNGPYKRTKFMVIMVPRWSIEWNNIPVAACGQGDSVLSSKKPFSQHRAKCTCVCVCLYTVCIWCVGV